MAQTRKSGFQISYVTITYRSVALVIICVLLLAFLVMELLFPSSADRLLRSSEGFFEKGLAKIGLISNPGDGNNSGTAGPQQAHFTNIDGEVMVRRGSTWIPADYNVALETGDVIQTKSQGIAKIVFADGTNYTIKPDSLIRVEENSVNAAQQTAVKVEVNTGTVDLSTSSMTQGSKSQVVVAGATATLGGDTRAEVMNDPRNDQHEIMLKSGTGVVHRDATNETVAMAPFERVSFKSDSQITKIREIGPPNLIDPANMYPKVVASNSEPVTFSWTQAENARQYRFKLSRNPYFSSLVLNRLVDGTEIQLSYLPEGSYYWAVQSVGSNGKESVESEKNRFTLIMRQESQVGLMLELDEFVQHGHIIEVRGRTENSAHVMVNDQQVAVINPDGSFHHFTPPLPTGENIITITAQNAKGGVNTKTQKVVIQ